MKNIQDEYAPTSPTREPLIPSQPPALPYPPSGVPHMSPTGIIRERDGRGWRWFRRKRKPRD